MYVQYSRRKNSSVVFLLYPLNYFGQLLSSTVFHAERIEYILHAMYHRMRQYKRRVYDMYIVLCEQRARGVREVMWKAFGLTLR